MEPRRSTAVTSSTPHPMPVNVKAAMEPRRDHRGDTIFQSQLYRYNVRPQWSCGENTAVTTYTDLTVDQVIMPQWSRGESTAVTLY